jgi:SAM-dependent methyltransferase
VSGTVTELHPLVPAADDRPEGAGADHPMRTVTRQVAFEPGGWDAERRAKVARLFNDLAPEWHTRLSEERLEVVFDALDRGGLPGGAGTRCVEVGSGTGFATPILADRFGTVLAVDVAIEMLRRAPADEGHRVLADAARLPVPDGGADVVVLVNALLFPGEVDRVLRPDGAVVWVSSLGDRTPIYLSAHDVVAALPGDWRAVSSTAGWGTWSVHRRV